jgi:phospholipid/cholesterol/gamma-HCH transport system substrate-binding protein
MTPFREQNKTVIGAIGLTIILAILYGSFKTDSLPIIGGGSVYAADFTEAAGLQKMDEVRVAGVKVGKVTKISLKSTGCDGAEGGCVVVQMRLKGIHVGPDTSAAIRIKTVLGRKYIALDPQGSGDLRGEIPVSHTSSPFDVSPAFQELAGRVSKIDTTQLAQSFTVLADDFRTSPADVRASLNGLSRLSATIASRDAKLKALLDHAKGVTTVLAARDTDLIAFMRSSNLILDELKARRAAIHALLTTTTELSNQLIALVRENRTNLAPALASLKGVVAVLRANQDNLDKGLAQFAPFVRLFSNNLGNGRWFDTVVQNLTNPVGFVPGSFGKS